MPGPYDLVRTAVDKVRSVFGRPGKSLPTPNVEDFLVVENFTNLTEATWLLPYGSPHPKYKDATGAPLYLVKQDREQGTQEGQFTVQRVYGNTPIAPDAYNASVSFTAKSDAHRILVRSYLVLRSAYTPLAELTPDSQYPSALCTDESQQKAEDPWGTLYVRVSRTFEDFGLPLSVQDAWNRRDALPYLLATAPKITRTYRLPANNDPIAAGALVVGTSTDSAVPAALLTSVARQDESVRVRVYTCIFDSFPTTDALIASGLTGSLGVAVAYPYDDTNFPKVTWTYLAKDAASQKVAPLSACPIPGYTSALLVEQSFDPTVLDGAPVYGGTVTRVYETFATQAQQDTWNEQERSLPFISDAYPKIVRKYRYPSNAVYLFTVGTTTDTVYTSAILTDKDVADEGTTVRIITATFETFPTPDQQAALGSANSTGGLGLTLAYPYGDLGFPVLTIKSILLNDSYSPSAINAACPVPGFTTLVLTDESRAPDADAPSKTILTREYQILPGCIVSSTDAARLPRTLTAIPPYYLNGDLLTTTVQLLPYLTNGVPTVADTLSLTLLKSAVEPHGKWYVTKTNVQRTDPTLPTVWLPKQADSVDGADGIEYRLMVRVSDPSTLQGMVAAAVTTMKGLSGNLIDYHTNAVSPTEEELVYTIVNTFPYRIGQEYDARLGVALPFSEQIMTATTAQAVAGNAFTTITPLPGQDNLVRVRVNTPPTVALDSYVRSFPTDTSMSLPDVLVGFNLAISTGQGNGNNTETGSGQSAGGDSGSISLNVSNSCEGSATILPALSPVFASRPVTSDLPATEYFVYLPNNSTRIQALAHLNALTGLAVQDWPIFAPRPLNFEVMGQKTSVRASAQARMSLSGGSSGISSAQSQGGGTSQDWSDTIRTVEIRETLHAALTITLPQLTQTTSATSAANLNVASLTPNATRTASGTVSAAVLPASVPATTPYSAIPAGGLYAQRFNVTPSEFGVRDLARFVVFDFGVLPPVSGATGAPIINASGSAYPTTVPNPPAGLYTTGITPSDGYPAAVFFGFHHSNDGLTGFKVSRATSATGPFAQVAAPSPVDQEFLDYNITAGTTYFYQVVASNALGDSSPSVIVAGATTLSGSDPGGLPNDQYPAQTYKPAPPFSVTAATLTGGGVVVTWSDTAVGIRSFKVLRATQAGSGTVSAYAQIGLALDPTSKTYADTTATTSGTTYFYQIVATNTVGDSNPSAVASQAVT